MNKLIIGLGSSALLLTGCSSTSSTEPKYDEVELVIFQLCMEDYLVADRSPASSFDRDYPHQSLEDTRNAYEACKDLEPMQK